MRYFFPSRISAIQLTQPMTGIVLAWIVLNEEPGPLLWVGGVFVMAGAVLAQRRDAPRKSATTPAARRIESMPEKPSIGKAG